MTDPPRDKNRHRLLVCDGCDFTVRAAYSRYASGRATGGHLTCMCGLPMRLADINDAGRLSDDGISDDDLNEHPDWKRHLQREENKAKRERRAGHPQFRCGGCGQFIKATNTHCTCGFANDIRGPRNDGSWQPYRDPQERFPF